MKIALVYDRVNKWGGAERVLLALHELFPSAPLFTSVYNSQTAPWAKAFTVIPSFLQDFPFAKKAHEFYPLLMPIAFESFSFDEFDLVISVTSEAAKGVITKPSTLHLCYCLTPTRYLWSGYDEYFSSSIVRFLSIPAVAYLRTWDRVASTRPDNIISISSEVQERVRKYYNRDSQIIYPPVSLHEEYTTIKRRNEGYYLIVSRLVAYKRLDIAIEACNRLKAPLKIIGTGSEEKRLRRLAGPTVEFIGSVTDTQLATYYQSAKAFLFPGREDFGITMVEALGFGIPVIAYKGGGALDIIEDKKSGIFFERQTVNSLISAMKEADTRKFDLRDVKKRAALFSKKRFQDEFMKTLEESLRKRKKTI